MRGVLLLYVSSCVVTPTLSQHIVRPRAWTAVDEELGVDLRAIDHSRPPSFPVDGIVCQGLKRKPKLDGRASDCENHCMHDAGCEVWQYHHGTGACWGGNPVKDYDCFGIKGKTKETIAEILGASDPLLIGGRYRFFRMCATIPSSEDFCGPNMLSFSTAEVPLTYMTSLPELEQLNATALKRVHDRRVREAHILNYVKSRFGRSLGEEILREQGLEAVGFGSHVLATTKAIKDGRMVTEQTQSRSSSSRAALVPGSPTTKSSSPSSSTARS